MKKTTIFSTLFMAAMSLLVVSACSNDETVEVRDTAANKIAYSVATNTLSRAAAIYSNSNIPSSMYVWATYNPSDAASSYLVYFSNDTVKTTVTNGVATGTGSQYWPNSGKLNFFALSGIATAPTGENWHWGDTYKTPSFNYTLKEKVAEQEDLLYAVAAQQAKPTTEGSNVALNFRHALAQVDFKVKVTHPDLYVVVKSISVNNVNTNGTFILPENTTTAGIDSSHKDYDSNDVIGKWNVRQGHGKYTTSFVATGDTNWGVTLGSGSNETNEASATSQMMLIPGTYGDYALEGGKTPTDENVYISLVCKIYHKVSGTNTESGDIDSTLGVLLWDGSTSSKAGAEAGTEREIYIPAKLNWTVGRKYTYTIIFGGDSHAGWDGDDPTNKVLFPISYQSTVDNWIETTGDDYQVKM